MRTLRTRGYVIADFEERREKIRAGVNELAEGLGGVPVSSDELLDEVTALVEWPVPLAGEFEARFLELPREVLIATLQDHQRYFPLAASDGRLLPTFIDLQHLTLPTALAMAGIVVLLVGGIIGAYALAAAQARGLLNNRRYLKLVNRTAGTMMIGAGVTVATQ